LIINNDEVKRNMRGEVEEKMGEERGEERRGEGEMVCKFRRGLSVGITEKGEPRKERVFEKSELLTCIVKLTQSRPKKEPQRKTKRVKYFSGILKNEVIIKRCGCWRIVKEE
jgi:hypothetical protein